MKQVLNSELRLALNSVKQQAGLTTLVWILPTSAVISIEQPTVTAQGMRLTLNAVVYGQDLQFTVSPTEDELAGLKSSELI